MPEDLSEPALPAPANTPGNHTASSLPTGMQLMWVAGENSGDLHASRLILELKRLLPGLECFGYGGDRMEAAGMRLEENLAQKLPVIGFTQALRHIRKFRQLLSQARQMLIDRKPQALVLVDYPGFNLRLAAIAHQLGVPVIYFISPQIWAWHQSRLKIIAETVSLMLVILPFEESLYRRAGVPVSYVGHPLLDDLEQVRPRDEVLARLGIDPQRRVIGLVPGSRKPEVIRHLPVMLEAAQTIRAKLPDVEFVLPRASSIPAEMIDKYLARYPQLKVTVADRDLKSVRKAMDFAVCKSGTSTLELALMDVPMIVIYKVSTPTYWLARTFIRIPWIGLVNIVANEMVCPELIQGEANPQRISQEVQRYLSDDQALADMRRGLLKVRAQMGEAGASQRAAEEITRLLTDKE